jgi:hypothetical protein
MTTLCIHLQNILQEVYEACFPESQNSVTFRLRASPRMEVNNIQVSLLLISLMVISVYFRYL